MKLMAARVRNFRSISDSGTVPLGSLTCLVGKNESGKTAFLEALWGTKSAHGQERTYDPTFDYPKKAYAQYKKRPKEAPSEVATLELRLTDDELHELEERYGKGILQSQDIEATYHYGGHPTWRVPVGIKTLIDHLVNSNGIGGPAKGALMRAEDWPTFVEKVRGSEAQDEAMQKLQKRVDELAESPGMALTSALKKMLPTFFYFDEYSMMPSQVNLLDLKTKVENKQPQSKEEQTFLAFLDVAGTSIEELVDEENYERIKAELESASLSITNQVFKFWSQNRDLKVELDRENRKETGPNGSMVVRPILHVRVSHLRHGVSQPFGNRSKGFVWFFSFLCYFSRLESESNVVVLLDEPGLNLHALAQRDFLRMIEELLEPTHQVVYTTHSPFMIDMNRLDTVRTVEDHEEGGTIVTEDVLNTSKETLFPLQAALGYSIAQSLFVGENCLIVEGPSDLMYLEAMSEYLKGLNRTGLHSNWVITPVGGAEKIPTFVSLLGSNNLNLVALTDLDPQFKQRVRGIRATGLLDEARIVSPANLVDAKEADLEDLFGRETYVEFVNGAYQGMLEHPIAEGDLGKHPRVVKAVTDVFEARTGNPFSHARVARYVSRTLNGGTAKLTDKCLDRFEGLFRTMNAVVRG